MRSAFASNGSFAVLYDQNFYIRDLYYPYLGTYNHGIGGKFHVGIWHDGRFAWFEALPDKRLGMQGLTVTLEASWDGLQISIKDVVTLDYPALLRKVHVEGPGYVRLIFYNDFRLNEYDIGDTTFYDPSDDLVYHYKDTTWFAVGSTAPIYEYTTGRRDQNAVLPDCEDGSLGKNPIAQGSVASAISVAATDFYLFMVAGRNQSEARLAALDLRAHPDFHMTKTEVYWDGISSPPYLGDDLAKSSTSVLLGHVGDNGAIPASLDTSILKFNLDTYAYTWPRDASLAAMVAGMAGYWSFTKKYFSFAFNLFCDEGYLYQKFNADGSLGSTWHPWTVRSKTALNFQEDETSTLVYAFWDYFSRTKDYDLLRQVYDRVVKAADFMVSFRDPKLKLPLESYDLWEERLGVHAYTVSSVVAGLRASSALAHVLGDEPDALKWAEAADETLQAMKKLMVDQKSGTLLRTVRISDGAVSGVDRTLDSSLLGAFTFGVLDPLDPVLRSTAEALEERLWVRGSGGLARYENDMYQRVAGDYAGIPGNPWIITTAWLAQYKLAAGQRDSALQLMEWIRSARGPSGLFPEQVSPFDKSPLSVAPLLWSHAEYLKTSLQLNGMR